MADYNDAADSSIAADGDGSVPPQAVDQDAEQDQDLDAAASIADDSVPGTTPAPSNPRKRKKSSRACDFCHVNHQPCDNAKPRCGYCQRHNKSCLYLRPQKKRGPAQGYRSALHTLRESAAAWGVALNLIPSLGPVVEGYLRQPEGRRLVKAIKDPAQQEFFIQAWQQSGVFKAFFPDESTASDKPDDTLPDVAAASGTAAAQVSPSEGPSFGYVPNPSPSSQDDGGRTRQSSTSTRHKSRQESISFSDILAKDAARSSIGFSQTLGSLGFAPNETLEDFLDMTFNPEPVEQPRVQPDSLLGTEQDQQAYYELLMGRRFG
ncbi:hypothetical protein BD289DRAFT_449830 [Coniella lustricola]|uniref:Zn(2)-C6 fungal-type domain-containing protein n=1 Tax=Coniella lustricola TaxID=2025994 RepID=A0A2T3AKY8_9PEZI|nr:hypothetical protein BD289DRAFT_449830 [Coniella lustricola]